MLTQLELKMLETIKAHIQAHAVSPTIAEIASELNMKSRGTVHRYVQSLIDKKLLVREGTGWRGLRLVNEAAVVTILSPSISYDAPTVDDGTSLLVPLLGRIAAGMPIEAIPDETHLDLAAFFIGPDRYALRVSGDSMMDAGIMDGDTVILRNQSTARSGDIVVALIDEQEATLKRLGLYNDSVVELIPENSTMTPMRYSAARVAIQGVLIGQLRSY